MKSLSVSEFVSAVSGYLEQGLGSVAVQGEVVDWKVNRGKLVYFELKDERSRVLCFSLTHEMPQTLEDGMEVVIVGVPKLFQKSGGFHLRVRAVELVGEGALRRAFELTKKKLTKEGVFDEKYKKALPRFPERVGLITSHDAAAYTDVLRILENRWGGLDISLASVRVQGTPAVGQIVRAIEYFNTSQPVDVLLLTRGGGSLEDLQAFNSEKVARAVFASKIPIVVGVGHERDETLAEYAADVRASTPSNAAEILVPDREEFGYQLEQMELSLARGIQDKLSKVGARVDTFVSRLEGVVRDIFVRFERLEQRLRQRVELFGLRATQMREKCDYLDTDLRSRAGAWLTKWHQKIDNTIKLFSSLDPEATLRRGYSITLHKGKVLMSTKQVKKGDEIETRVQDGEISSEVVSG